MENFKKELEQLINKTSRENDSNTPDFILAEFLTNCLSTFNFTIQRREAWYGREPKKPEEKILCKSHAENLADNLIKTANDHNYHCLCARSTIYPGKTISEVEEILKSYTAEYILDRDYSNLTDIFRKSVRRIIREKTGTIPDSEKCTSYMFLSNNTMLLNGKKYKLIPCDVYDRDDWEITLVMINGCPCGYNGKKILDDVKNCTIQEVRVGKKKFVVGQTLINDRKIKGFTLHNNRVYALVEDKEFKYSDCTYKIDIVEL
jgi:hypothetical protein